MYIYICPALCAHVQYKYIIYICNLIASTISAKVLLPDLCVVEVVGPWQKSAAPEPNPVEPISSSRLRCLRAWAMRSPELSLGLGGGLEIAYGHNFLQDMLRIAKECQG